MSDDAILREKQRRLRELQKQQARFGIDTRPQIETEIEDLEAEIADLNGSAARAGLPRPPQPDFAHPYPIQSGFTGRVTERKMLTGWLSSSPQPVLAVIGIGGMGKSALTWAWLQRDVLGLPLPGATEDAPAVAAACRLSEATRPEGVLWWSFYETQASFASFLDEAIGYASNHSMNPRDLPSTYDKARALLNLLQQRRLLLVLDGFERELRAYASLGAAYQGDAVDKQPRGEHRACADLHAGRFLRDAATLPLQSRILLTSRLFPRELDDLAGCRRADLKTIDPEDAVTFFHSQGIRGTRAEIQAACAPYGYHALALRLLAGVVKKNKRTPGDIKVVGQYPVLPELKGREQHHILQVAYDQLDRPKRALLSRLAAFRSPMPYDALAALNNYTDSDRFDRALDELEDRGLLFFDRDLARYDMHPVVRGYAYDRLGDKATIHIRLRDYFAAVPAMEKVQSLSDLIPAIELYHHTVRAGRLDEAIELLRNRLSTPLYFQLGVYQTCIELLQTLFPKDERQLPKLPQRLLSWVLEELANSYSAYGQPKRAVSLYKLSLELDKSPTDNNHFVKTMRCLADTQVRLGQLAEAEQNLRRNVELCRTLGNIFNEAGSHHFLGTLLAYQGAFKEAKQELDIAMSSYRSQRLMQPECIAWADFAFCTLLRGDAKSAFDAAQRARDLAEEVTRMTYPREYDVIFIEWLVGATLVAQIVNHRLQGMDRTRELTTLAEAEIFLTRALTRCRRINLIEVEPDILLTWARWHQLQGNAAQAQDTAAEALMIAERCEYRLKQADIHNFLARLALDTGDRAAARRHAAIARERAWCDGPPHCYKPALDAAERLIGEIG